MNALLPALSWDEFEAMDYTGSGVPLADDEAPVTNSANGLDNTLPHCLTPPPSSAKCTIYAPVLASGCASGRKQTRIGLHLSQLPVPSHGNPIQEWGDNTSHRY